MSEMSEIVIFETSMGVIEIEMDRENAPITVENFVKYASNGFLDVVDRIASVRTGGRGMNRDWPVEDITIKRAYVKN